MATKSYRRCEKYSDAKCTIVCWEMSCGLWQIFQSFFKSRSPRHLPCTAREMPFDKRAQFSRRFDGEEINDESFCCKPAMAAVYDTRMAGGEREEESIKRLLSSGEACAFWSTGFGSLTLSRRDWRAKRLLIRTHRCAVTYKAHCLSTISSAATDPTNRVFKACFALGLFSRRTPQLYTCTLNVSGHLMRLYRARSFVGHLFHGKTARRTIQNHPYFQMVTDQCKSEHEYGNDHGRAGTSEGHWGGIASLPYQKGGKGGRRCLFITGSQVISCFIKIDLKQIYCSYSRTRKFRMVFYFS